MPTSCSASRQTAGRPRNPELGREIPLPPRATRHTHPATLGATGGPVVAQIECVGRHHHFFSVSQAITWLVRHDSLAMFTATTPAIPSSIGQLSGSPFRRWLCKLV